MLQVGALQPVGLGLGQLHRGQPAGQPVEADHLQRVLPEPGLDQVVQGQRRLLHRPPAAVLHHRERQVDAQRDRSAGPPLGLDDLEVLDLERHAAGGGEAAPAQGVGHRPRCVDRQLVAEHPRPASARSARRPRRSAGRRGRPCPRPRAGRTPAQRGLAEPAYGPRGQPQPVVAAGQESLPLQLALQLAQRPEVARGLGSEPLLQQLDVDVVEGRAGVRLARAGPAAPPGRPARPPPRRPRCSPSDSPPGRIPAGESRSRPGRSARRLSPSWAICEARSASARAWLISWPSCSRCSGLSEAIIRWAAACRRASASISSSTVSGCSGKNSPCLSMNSRERVGGVLVAGVRGQQRVEVGQHVLDPLHRLGIG